MQWYQQHQSTVSIWTDTRKNWFWLRIERRTTHHLLFPFYGWIRSNCFSFFHILSFHNNNNRNDDDNVSDWFSLSVCSVWHCKLSRSRSWYTLCVHNSTTIFTYNRNIDHGLAHTHTHRLSSLTHIIIMWQYAQRMPTHITTNWNIAFDKMIIFRVLSACVCVCSTTVFEFVSFR